MDLYEIIITPDAEKDLVELTQYRIKRLNYNKADATLM